MTHSKPETRSNQAVTHPAAIDSTSPHSEYTPSTQSLIIPTTPPVQTGVFVYTLGHFSASLFREGEHQEAVWANRQVRGLFMYLLAAPGHCSTRDQLIEWLWPNSPLDLGRAYLRHALSRLRRSLDPSRSAFSHSPYIISDRDQVRLVITTSGLSKASLEPAKDVYPKAKTEASELPGIWIDAVEFAGLAEQALAVLSKHPKSAPAWSAAEQALDMYQGEFLAIERYNDVVERARQRYFGLWATLIQYVAHRAILEQQYTRAILLLNRLLDIAPEDEVSVADLMYAQLGAGQRAEALKSYQRLARRMQSMFGCMPASRVRNLYVAIRDNHSISCTNIDRAIGIYS